MGTEPRLASSKTYTGQGKRDVSCFLELVPRRVANKVENVYKVHSRYKDRSPSIQGAYNLVLKVSNYEQKEY